VSILPSSKHFGDNLSSLPQVLIGTGKEFDEEEATDLGAPIIPIKVDKLKIKNAILDYGADVSILPGMLYDQYEFGPLQELDTTVVLADFTCKHPRGIVKDMTITLGEFHYPVDFMVLDCEPVMTNEQPRVILGRPFLATANAQINCRAGTIDLAFKTRKLRFDVFSKSINYFVNDEQCEVGITNVGAPPYISHVNEGIAVENDLEYDMSKHVDLKEMVDLKETKESVMKVETENKKPKRKKKVGDPPGLIKGQVKASMFGPMWNKTEDVPDCWRIIFEEQPRNKHSTRPP